MSKRMGKPPSGIVTACITRRGTAPLTFAGPAVELLDRFQSERTHGTVRAMPRAMTRSGSSPTAKLRPVSGPIRLAAALLGLAAGMAPGGCGGAEPARGNTPALSQSPAHDDAAELDRPGIEPPAGREPEPEETAAEEEAPPPSEEGLHMDNISEGPKVVPFVSLRSQRIAGARTIEPSTHEAKAIDASGRPVLGVVQLCLDAAGAPTKVTPVRSTGYPDYDARIRTGVERWRFRPYLDGDKPVPVCTSVTITYRPDPQPSLPPPRKDRDKDKDDEAAGG